MSLDTADAAELAELLHFLGDWLATDHDRMEASLRRFVGTTGSDAIGYDVEELRRDLDRFTFLLGGDDGETLFIPDHRRR